MFISAASILIPINNKNNYSNHNNNYTNKVRQKHQTWNNTTFDNNNLFYGYDRKDTKLSNDTTKWQYLMLLMMLELARPGKLSNCLLK